MRDKKKEEETEVFDSKRKCPKRRSEPGAFYCCSSDCYDRRAIHNYLL